MTSRPRILDGGTATGLQAAGIPMLEPWLTSAPLRTAAGADALVEVHAEFLRSGSDVVTANTFRTNSRALSRMGVAEADHRDYVHRAVTCAVRAREAAGTPHALVAASVAPVEDCYTPALTPDEGSLRREHRWLAGVLAETETDLVLVETQCTRREAVIAVEAAVRRGLTAWVSFVVTNEITLPDGDALDEAARACADAGAAAVAVNCLPPAAVPRALQRLSGLGVPVGVYPNLEDRAALAPWEHSAHTLPPALSPTVFADLAHGWAARFAPAFVGGCCGTAPAHISALSDKWKEEAAA
ncbi:homocysteine S-methyltransferase family protein [Streptomyces sp. TLI_185]|uniref:homocysteine S-methyltransferase family protein n=1 Tax=Streptomyces sp. TLI_185 TaxID=2485151 RepID=UPI000F4D4F91|nr:homocysteine S-methyltransferase family protein [Streptomyces sp. TLI_185]RPF35116.1 homocysteine S-methyltransferase [Streptomyces sp. TLI_185]